MKSMKTRNLPFGRGQDVLIEPREPHGEETLRGILRKCGLKLTSQRLSILKALNAGPRVHMTAQDIMDEARKICPAIGFATVYRLLKRLTSAGIVSEITMGSGPARYEFKSKQFHYHISCVHCEKIVEFKNKTIESILKRIVEEKGYRLEHQLLELYVVCDSSNCKRFKDRSQ